MLHHLRAGLPDSRNTVLFAGFQAVGTRGRSLVDGATVVKIHGQMVPVHARIARIESMSAHADSHEILRWLGGFTRPPRTTFIVHGELPAMEALQASIEQKLGWSTKMPSHGDGDAVVAQDFQSAAAMGRLMPGCGEHASVIGAAMGGRIDSGVRRGE